MNLRNTKQGYGAGAKALHWLIALLILLMLCAGFFMTGLSVSPFKFQVYALHKSIGVSILALAALRVLWRLSNTVPEALDTHQRWEKILAKATHYLLYAAMITMPLSGWIMTSASDFPVKVFGLFTLPHIVPKNPALAGLAREVHGVAAWALIALIGLHIAGALKHHFLDRDFTLKRMTYRRLGFGSAVFLAFVSCGLLFNAIGLGLFGEEKTENPPAAHEKTAAPQAADKSPDAWVIDKGKSHIDFEATQYGSAFHGTFSVPDGTIVFDPQNLAASRADIAVDINSIDTGSADRNAQALAPDWFDAGHYPIARFHSENFEKIGGGHYIAHGRLSLHGIEHPLDLPFVLTLSRDPLKNIENARMEAKISMNRQDFRIGQGQWQDSKIIGNEIVLSLEVVAARPDPGK